MLYIQPYRYVHSIAYILQVATCTYFVYRSIAAPVVVLPAVNFLLCIGENKKSVNLNE